MYCKEVGEDYESASQKWSDVHTIGVNWCQGLQKNT